MTIKEISKLPDGFEALLDESVAQNFNFLKKMQEEWISGKNQFNKNGERAFAVFDGNILIGIGGLNIDPYLPNDQIGRVRHLYILSTYRKNGAGKLLMNEIIKTAKLYYPKLRLKTDTAIAAKFYESLGFAKVTSDSASHELVF